MAKKKKKQKELTGKEFFANILYGQAVEANAGWTIVTQNLVTELATVTLKKGTTEENAAQIENIKSVMGMTKEAQLGTIEIMKAIQGV